MSDNISFFSEDIEFSLKHSENIKQWISSICESYNFKITNINYIFCSDDYLLGVNKKHLNHNYYTDIITFDLSEYENEIESDIFISIDRVKENGNKNNSSFEQELKRVLIHGVLHLIGFNDKTEEEKQVMRKKEEACLSLYSEN